MQSPPPNPPDKERPFRPRPERRGLPGSVSVKDQKGRKDQQEVAGISQQEMASEGPGAFNRKGSLTGERYLIDQCNDRPAPEPARPVPHSSL